MTDTSRFESLYPVDSRAAEINQIVNFVKNGNSCQIVSLPGVGRSNLLGLLSYNRAVRIKHFGTEGQTKYHFVLLNFSEIRKKPLPEATKFIFLGLVDSLRERGKKSEIEHLQNLFKEALSTSDEIVIFQGLKKAVEFLTLEAGLTIIFLFDRFEEYVPMLSQEFFGNLRVLRNLAKYKFSVVFSLNRPLEDVLEPITLSDFYEFLEGNIIYLSVKDPAGLAFRISYFEKSNKVKTPQKVLNEILEATAGHGKLTRLCLEAYYSVDDTTRNQFASLSGFFLSKERVRGVLREIWNFLTPEEQVLIQTEKTSKFLEQIGLEKDGKLLIPLLGEYAKLKGETIERKIAEEKIAFDSQRNEIVKGSVVLSDLLTSAEFNLLKFLLQNPDTIIARDLMVNAVWGDLASTEGVTDQALDQLIFRLRKKIEENPENPTHIQTIKGRGIKFIP